MPSPANVRRDHQSRRLGSHRAFHDVTWLTGTLNDMVDGDLWTDPQRVHRLRTWRLDDDHHGGHRDRFEGPSHSKPAKRGFGNDGTSIAAAGTTLVHLHPRSASFGMTRSTTKPTSTSPSRPWPSTQRSQDGRCSVRRATWARVFLTTDGDLVGMVPDRSTSNPRCWRRSASWPLRSSEASSVDIHEQSSYRPNIRRRNARPPVSAEGYGACNRSLERSPRL